MYIFVVKMSLCHHQVHLVRVRFSVIIFNRNEKKLFSNFFFTLERRWSTVIAEKNGIANKLMKWHETAQQLFIITTWSLIEIVDQFCTRLKTFMLPGGKTV